jgi:hypothetical protein
VLFDEVVIGPKRGEEKEDKRGARKHHDWTNSKKEQRAPEQAPTVLPLGLIEVSTGKRAEDMRRIYQDGP